MSEFKDAMKRVWAKISQGLDQNLAVAKTEYFSLSSEDRASFRDWVLRVAELQDSDGPIHAKSRIQVIPNRDDLAAVYLSPNSLRRAIEAWDRGEEYLPDKLGDI